MSTGRHRCRCPRALHLLDLENLLGQARDADSVVEVWQRWTARVPMGRDDQVVVATGPSLAPVAWFALPPTVRRLVGFGLDGADRALVESVDPDHVARRFGRVVLGSGDHAFTPMVRELRLLGAPTWLALGRGHTSRVLVPTCPRRLALFSGRRTAQHAG